jgi:hypothetical protein
VVFDSVSPRMSRDFFVNCGNAERAAQAARVLSQALADDGTPLFEVDKRGTDIFAMLVYARDIDAQAGCRVGDTRIPDLRSHVAFVALKNGEHDGIGYLIDTGKRMDPEAAPIALASIPSLVADYLLPDTRLFGIPPYRAA